MLRQKKSGKIINKKIMKIVMIIKAKGEICKVSAKVEK